MIFLALPLAVALALAVAFYTYLGGSFLVANVSPLLAVLSIFAAGILVRLNRGIPTIDWKSVDADATHRLLNQLEAVAKEYVAVFCIIVLSIVVVFAASFVDQSKIENAPRIQQWLAGSFGFLFGVLSGRMGYIVWRDLDIVRLQKAVILSAATEEVAKSELAAAQEKLTAMSAARLPRIQGDGH